LQLEAAVPDELDELEQAEIIEVESAITATTAASLRELTIPFLLMRWAWNATPPSL
jgi:CheY-specific phosphatase CheX